MLKLRNRKLTTIGGSRGFIIPKDFIENLDVRDDKLYTVIIEEIKDDKKQPLKTAEKDQLDKAPVVYEPSGDFLGKEYNPPSRIHRATALKHLLENGDLKPEEVSYI